MKRIAALIFALCAAAALSGCAHDPEDVKLASPSAMARWCGREYGDATVVDSTAGDEVIVYTMRDSDFSAAYRKLFLSDCASNIAELERMYAVAFDFDDPSYFTLAAVRGSDVGGCRTAAEDFSTSPPGSTAGTTGAT